MEKQIIGRGLLAGALAGVLAFVFAKIFLEPIIGRAIDFEDGTAAAHEAMETAPAGIATRRAASCSPAECSPTSAWAWACSCSVSPWARLFAVVFCVAYSRVGNVSARKLSVLVAGAMLISLWVVPALKYPPNPPATSLDETINQRALLYLLMVALSALLMVAAVYLGRQLTPKLGAWNATLAAARRLHRRGLVVMLILPTINETPGPMVNDAGTIVFPGFPAVDLYEFRLYTLAPR